MKGPGFRGLLRRRRVGPWPSSSWTWPGPASSSSSCSRMSTLACDEVLLTKEDADDEELKTAVFVHGLLGSGRNWRTFGKQLAQAVAERSSSNSLGWRLVFVDLRNHGQSASLPGFDPPHDIPSAAKDLSEFVKAQPWGWPDVVVGHSLGGKVVLEFALKCIAGSYGSEAVAPKQLWVLDSVPGAIPIDNEGGEVERVLATLKSLPDPIPSRRWLQEHMTKLGFSPGLSAWMGSNLKRVDKSKEEMTWIFNLPGAYDMFKSYRQEDYWSVLENPPKGMKIGVVRAIRSDRWSPEIAQRLEKLATKNSQGSEHSGILSYHILANAGHWLHSDNPVGLAQILAPSLTELSAPT